MLYRLAKSLDTFRSQVNALYLSRDKESDGWIGDTRHKNSKSDHNPNSAGVVTAIDIDEDVRPGSDAMPIVNALIASRDLRIKYVIYEGRMIRNYRAKDGTAPWVWTPYKGKNPHKHHFHLSVSADPKLYDDPRPWALNITNSTAADSPADNSANADRPITPNEPATSPHKSPSIRTLQVKNPLMHGEDVYALQAALVGRGFMTAGQVDGVYGERTMKAVRTFQESKGLRPDGMAGPNTFAALNLNK